MKTLHALAVLVSLSSAVRAEPSASPAFFSALTGLSASVGRVTMASQQEQDILLQLFNDSDPAVRRSALKAFRVYVGQRQSHWERVLQIARDTREDASVRHEAIKTLSVVSGYNNVSDGLLWIAQRDAAPALRMVAYKALYWQAMSRSSMADELLREAVRGGDADLRRAAIWGLFLAVGNTQPREALLRLAERDSDAGVRVEALKSLYGAMGHTDVRDTVMRLARTQSGEPSVRLTAILALSARNNNDGRDILEAIARRDADPLARAAAITALGDPLSDDLVRHFHMLRRDQSGRVIRDPLDLE